MIRNETKEGIAIALCVLSVIIARVVPQSISTIYTFLSSVILLFSGLFLIMKKEHLLIAGVSISMGISAFLSTIDDVIYNYYKQYESYLGVINVIGFVLFGLSIILLFYQIIKNGDNRIRNLGIKLALFICSCIIFIICIGLYVKYFSY